MTDHVEVVPVFPTPVYFAICEEDISDCVEFLENAPIKIEYEDGVAKQYGTISVDDYILDDPKLATLREWILGHVENYAEQVLAWKFNEISITQSWVSVKNKGERHKYHIHPNSLISGVFFWNDEEVEELSFLRPRKFSNIEIERDQTINAPYAFDHHNFSPRKNTLILFPSELQHGVAEVKSDSSRKSLAFNTFIYETIGNRVGLSQLHLSKPSN